MIEKFDMAEKKKLIWDKETTQAREMCSGNQDDMNAIIIRRSISHAILAERH